jgi:PHP family Zn ribbon phosphoesterase
MNQSSKCAHTNLVFQYVNQAKNTVHNCEDCGRLIIKKPGDETLYTLDNNIQVVPVNEPETLLQFPKSEALKNFSNIPPGVSPHMN